MLLQLKNFLLDFVFPINCLNCNRPGYYLCPECADKIERCLNNKCPFCGILSPRGKTCLRCREKKYLDQLLAFAYFTNPLIEQVIYHLKYRSVYLVARDLGQVMAQAVGMENLFENKKDSLLVPVPMFSGKQKVRGFNQAELLAETLSLATKIPIAKNLLKKNRNTRPQMQIENEKKRRKNIFGAFLVSLDYNLEKALEKRIILIDDVATTGATLNACAYTLKEAGFREVIGLVVARQIKSMVRKQAISSTSHEHYNRP